MSLIADILAYSKWYRKFKGGNWYYNRYRSDMDIMFSVWERKEFTMNSNMGCILTTKKERYA